MGQTASEALPNSVGSILQQARTITDVASLSYEDFLNCIRQLNIQLDILSFNFDIF
jgi:hypothetical protein